MKSQIETLRPLIDPKSIAIIGATSDLTKIGGRPLKATIDFNYQGKIYPVNPKYKEIAGLTCYPSISEVPGEIDLALIIVPGSKVLSTVKECGERGVRSVIVMSSGFAEVGGEGAEIEAEMVRIGKEHKMRICGPNTVGMFNLLTGAIGNFGVAPHLGSVPKGRIAIVSQSGALCAFIYTLAAQRQIGLNYFVGTGNQSDVDVADCIAYFAEDPNTDVIACYIEGIEDTEKLRQSLELARNNRKPVVAFKVARGENGKKASLSHTATRVGPNSDYDSIFKKNGVYQVDSIREMLDVSYACSNGNLPSGKRIATLSISGAIGVILADQLPELGLIVPQTDPEVNKQLLKLIPYASANNPIDMTAQLVNEPHLMGEFLKIVLGNGSYDMVLTYISDLGYNKTILEQFLKGIEEVQVSHPNIPVLMSTVVTPETVKMIHERKIAVYDDPLSMAKAAKGLGEIGEHFASVNTEQPNPII
ncbi:acetate--CoA ligase family protein [Bacillus salipaludis]|uniref:Acetate--CoA ligase family protein n=1 Tax=Bacillus salipaludis TaxID=2547811 RepID=A0ABW8RCJ8_9BACI